MMKEKYRIQDEKLFLLVKEMQEGQVDNFTEVYNLSAKYIYKIIYDIVQNKDTTEDMLQETYLKIYNNIGSLQNPESFYVWAGRIATNLCIRYREKYRKETLLDTVEDGEGNEEVFFNTIAEDNEMFIPESVMENTEYQKMIAEILDGLSPEQKLAVQCFYFEEMSVREIAKEMDCSEGTIKSRLNYARKSIKDAVLRIEKEQGTKLYSLGGIPLLYFLFRKSAEDSVSNTAVSAGAVRVAKAVCDAASSATVSSTGANSSSASTLSSVSSLSSVDANSATSDAVNVDTVSATSDAVNVDTASAVKQAAGGAAAKGFSKWILIIIVSVAICGGLVVASVSGLFAGDKKGDNPGGNPDGVISTESQSEQESESKQESESEQEKESEQESESEQEELDYSEMKSVTLGDFYIRYDEQYELSESGTKLPYYGNYYFTLKGLYPVNSNPKGTTEDPFYYKSPAQFLENGALAPVWELYTTQKEESSTINKGASEQDENGRWTWGKYTALPKEMQNVLTGIIKPIYDQYFMTEAELKAGLGGDSQFVKKEDGEGRLTEYRYSGLAHYFDENGKKVETDKKEESFTWTFPNKYLASDKYPVERYQKFTVQTDEGTEYYAIQIRTIAASQSLYTSRYFNVAGVTAINKEFTDSYGSSLTIEMTLFRYYEKE